MKKKCRRLVFIVAILLCFCLVVDQVTAQVVPQVAVWGWSALSSAFNAANNLTTMVRVALVAPAFYSAASWVTATIVPNSAAILAGSLMTAGVVGGVALTAYLAYKGWQIYNGGIVLNGTTSHVVGLETPQTYDYSPTNHQIVAGTYTTAIAASNAAHSDGRIFQGPIAAFGGPGGAGWWGYYTKDANYNVNYNNYIYLYPANPANVVSDPGSPVSPSELIAAISQDLVSPDATVKAKAQAAVVETVKAGGGAVDTYLKNPPGYVPPAAYPGLTRDLMAQAADILRGGVSDADRQAMGAQDVVANYGRDALNPPVTVVTGGSLSKAEVEDAVKQGVEEAGSGLPAPSIPGSFVPPPQPPSPSKLGLTAVLMSFLASLKNLPIVSMFTGAHIEIAGANSVMVLPVALPGTARQITVDFADYEGVLDTLGTMLLTFVSIQWVMWLFTGRGDA